MSFEEVELADLLTQTLEANGCLAKIRAQLRANVFLALDEDAKVNQEQPLLNNKVKSFSEVPEGQLMFCLVKEFLEFFNLDFTLAVYEAESNFNNYYKYKGRQKLIDDLGIKVVDNNSSPVLLQLCKIVQSKSKTLEINLNINGASKLDENEESQNSNTKLSQTLMNSDEGHREMNGDAFLTNGSPKDSSEEIETDSTGSANFAKNQERDDTFNGTSPIPEESLPQFDSSIKSNESSTKQKSDKKSKDQPLNKARVSDILPSLYNNKELKSNSKEFGKFYDPEVEYEEDFMSGSEVEVSFNKFKVTSKTLLEELQQTRDFDVSKPNDNSNETNVNTNDSSCSK